MRKHSDIMGISVEEQFQEIYRFIEQARYADAVDLLEKMGDPRAQQWLAKLEDASPEALKSARALRAAGRYETARFILELAKPTGQRWLDSLQELKPTMHSDSSMAAEEAYLPQTIIRLIRQAIGVF